MKTCTIEGCERKFLARGWCATHYQRWYTSNGGAVGPAGLLRQPGSPDDTEKACTRCNVTKPIDQFHFERRNQNQRASQCKACFHLGNERRRVKRLYGLTPEEHEALKAARDGKCSICNRTVKLVIDHDHKTGAVRDLLCDRCNRLLGVANDDVELLTASINYINNHRKVPHG